MNKIIFRLSLLIAGFWAGASNVSAQVKTIADYPDSTIARYASLESRGFEVIPSSRISYTNGHTGGMLYLKVGREKCQGYQFPGNLKNSSRTVYGLYDIKKNSRVKYVIDLLDFMEKRDSLNVEKAISDFLSEIRSAKEFKKFFKIMTKKFGYNSSDNVTTDDLVRYVTLNNGKPVPTELLRNYDPILFCSLHSVEPVMPYEKEQIENIYKEECLECLKRDNTYSTDVRTDVVEQYVVLDDGKLNFPGCDEKVVRFYLSKYGLSYKSFDTYLSIRAEEKIYLNTFFIKNCGFVRPLDEKNGDTQRGCSVHYYDENVNGTNVRMWVYEASIDGDTYKKICHGRLYRKVGYNEEYIEGSDQTIGMPYADIEFRRFLARHLYPRRAIASMVEFDKFVSVSKDGNDVVAYHRERRQGDCNFFAGPHFQKRWDGRWTCSVPGRDEVDSITVVLDSTTTLAMLPFMEVEKAYLGVSDSDKKFYSIDMFDYLEESPNINVVLDDPQLGVKFEPAFQAGLWIESSADPKYSCRYKDLYLDNVASSSKVLYDKSHNYKLALGLDKSDPKHPQIVRNGIDSQKAENLKIAFENNEVARERRELAEWQANYIKEKSPIYGVNQIKTFVNKGYKPFIGMTWNLFKNEYIGTGLELIKESSNGDVIILEHLQDSSYKSKRWYYFYNNKLDHWTDRP